MATWLGFQRKSLHFYSLAEGKVWASALWMVVVLSAAAQPTGKENVIPLLSDTPLFGRVDPDGHVCYKYTMDAATTRRMVFLPNAKIYVKLDPCRGMPHLTASVYGCPSQGHTVTWEYQSEKARSEMRARGEKPPADWEWPGDIETLSIDVTHRTIYVEVSQYYPIMRTNASLWDLEMTMRQKGMDYEADRLGNISQGVWTPELMAEVRFIQRRIMSYATYELSLTLHDADAVPKTKIYPLSNTEGWVRDIESRLENPRVLSFQDDPGAYYYTIAFWPPTIAANMSIPQVNLSDDFTGELRRVGSSSDADLERAASGSDGHRELAAHPERAALGSDGHRELAAHPGSAEEQLRMWELERARALDVSWQQEIAETEERLRQLGMMQIPGLEDAIHQGRAHTHLGISGVRSGRRQEDNSTNMTSMYGNGSSSVGVNGSNTTGNHSNMSTSGGECVGVACSGLTLEQRAVLPLENDHLEFMVYWKDITEEFKDRWGTTVDSEGYVRTRLLSSPCGEQMKQCGVKQWIAKVEFKKLDRNNDGVLTREEYSVRYTPDRLLAGDTGFGTLYDFGRLQANVSGTIGVSRDVWELRYAGAEDILQGSFKDPLKRTYWTACGLDREGAHLALDGDVSSTTTEKEWGNMSQFGQLEDGRMLRSLKGLNDSDNNVYIVNVIVRHKVTGEQVAYKPHVLQRVTPVYKVPEVGGPTVGLIVGVSVMAVSIVIIIVVVVVLTRQKKMRPRLKVQRGGKAIESIQSMQRKTI